MGNVEFVFFNGRLLEVDQAQVSIHDAGLLHGVGLFETMRSYRGRVFRLADHLDRLYRSAEALQIPITQTRRDVEAGVEAILEANNLSDARLRLTVTRGNLRTTTDEPPESTLFITATDFQAYPEDMYRKGMTAVVCDYRQNPHDPTTGHKTINYLARLLALQQAQQKGAGEALWFTPTGRLAEGSISNVFRVHQETLLTPPLDTPVLPGITRNVVLELAEQAGITRQERELTIKDLLAAEEVFLTNSIMELMPVCRIERHAVGTEKPGPVYQRLHESYRQAVASYCQTTEKEGHDGPDSN